MTQRNEKARIVVVDDEPEMRKLLTAFLTSQGYSVECRASAEEAIAAVAQGPVPVAAVISDVRMKPMDGMALLSSLRKSHPNLPVLLFTRDASVAERKAALAQGAAEYFSTPFPLASLGAALRRALRS